MITRKTDSEELRAYIRCDLRIVNEKGISLVTAKA
ncbi:hypothetical protein B0H37_001909 [Clostridium beijerinckii]|nr:hypothetical protein [Clostridium beijerinckii]NOV69921.1 hypothetical protein [Clostridium beijerinckii]NOW31172.1 hypothetical protein [Clostridium beijerinckii]